jgi:hypothetical protein
MVGEHVKVRAQRDHFRNCVSLLAIDGGNDFCGYGAPVVFEPGMPGRRVDSPTLEITDEAAQRLLDDLWDAGYRPSDVGTAGHLAAVQKHLDHVLAQGDKMLSVILDIAGRASQ